MTFADPLIGLLSLLLPAAAITAVRFLVGRRLGSVPDPSLSAATDMERKTEIGLPIESADAKGQNAELLAQLNAAEKVATQAIREKSVILDNIGYEVRTPLNAIIGLSRLALNSGLGPQQYAFVETAERSARSLLETINDMLDFSRIEAGRMDIKNELFDIFAELDLVIDQIRPQASAKGLRLTLDRPTDLPRLLMGDSLRLRQILLNLGNNAVRHTERGEVHIGVELAERDAASAVLRFSVRDTGTGLTSEQRQRLFQPFSQGDAANSGGTGLGLAISYKVASLLGGRLEVESEPGKGSTFIFGARFDVPPADVELGGISKGSNSDPLPSFGRGLRVLLVDDSEVNQEIARDLLSRVGLSTTTARHGQQALDALEHETFDLVMMDLQMPQMDGYETIRRLRHDPRLAGLPVIAMTETPPISQSEIAIAAGMNDHIAKPIDAAKLSEMLKRWISPR